MTVYYNFCLQWLQQHIKAKFVFALFAFHFGIVGGQMVEAKEVSGQLRLDAALRSTDLSRQSPPVISSDGRYLAYTTTTTPPARSATSSYGMREEPYLPSGVLTGLFESNLHLMNLESGTTIEIHPGDWANLGPSFSPDGKWVAFYSSSSGNLRLWVAETATGRSRQIGVPTVRFRLFGNDNPKWSSDGTKLYVPILIDEDSSANRDVSKDKADAKVSRTNEEGRNIPSSHVAIAAIDIATGTTRTIASPAKGVRHFKISASGEWIAFLQRTEDPNIHELVVASTTGVEAKILASVQHLVHDGVISSDSGGPAYHWVPSKNQLVYVQEERLWSVDLNGTDVSSPRQLAKELGNISIQTIRDLPRPDSIVFTRDGQNIIARLKARDDITLAIIPTNHDAPHTIVVPEQHKFRGFVEIGNGIVWQPKPDEIAIMTYDQGTTSILSVDLKSGANNRIFRERANFAVVGTIGENDQHIIASFESYTVPRDLYQFDERLRLRARHRLTQMNPKLDEISLGRLSTFKTQIAAKNGKMETVNTAVFLPRDYRNDSPPPPAFVWIYPSFNGSERVSEFAGGRLNGVLASYYTTRGYAVVAVDLPITPIGEETNLIRELADALMPQVYSAAAQGYIDICRTAVGGLSYGAYGTAAILTATNLFRAGIAFSGAGYDMMTEPVAWWIGRFERFSNPWSNYKRYVTNSPFHQADLIETPLFLVHGRSDRLDFRQSETMYLALRKLSKSAQLALYEGEPHSLKQWSFNNAADATEQTLDYLARNLSQSGCRQEYDLYE